MKVLKVGVVFWIVPWSMDRSQCILWWVIMGRCSKVLYYGTVTGLSKLWSLNKVLYVYHYERIIMNVSLWGVKSLVSCQLARNLQKNRLGTNLARVSF